MRKFLIGLEPRSAALCASEDHLGPNWFAVRLRKRNVVRAGLGIVISLLFLTTWRAYQIQEVLSQETFEIYHRHVSHDDQLWSLRRTLWLGSSAARDFLLNPNADRAAKYAEQLAALRTNSADLLKNLANMPPRGEPPNELTAKVEDFWVTLERIPATTERLKPPERYQYIQNEIVSRRNVVGDLVREFTKVGQERLRSNDAELSHSRREAGARLLWAIGLSVVIALAVAGFSLARSEGLERTTARQYVEVEQAKIQLQQFAARLMQIQEEERIRLSRDLHDEIGQTLATLRLEISRAESLSHRAAPEILERLARARALAESTAQAVRDISVLLRPSLLDDLGLEPALEWQVEDFNRRTGVPCILRYDGSHDPLPEEVRTCVYRVVQESLHNCAKYASASQVTVSIVQSPTLLSVTVEDNGQGFDLAAHTKPLRNGRFGILGMRERAVALGGSLKIESSPGSGVRVVLQLPLEEPTTVAASFREVEAQA
jgi:signal transduction histidine kinase